MNLIFAITGIVGLVTWSLILNAGVFSSDSQLESPIKVTPEYTVEADWDRPVIDWTKDYVKEYTEENLRGTPKWVVIKKKKRLLLPKPVIKMNGGIVKLDNDLTCLIVNNYFEGRNRSDKKQLANSWTVLRRINSYGNSGICDAVTNAKVHKGTGLLIEGLCHYSWYCDKREVLVMGDTYPDRKAYSRVVKNATAILKEYRANGFKNDFTLGSTHYHRTDVNPSWNQSMKLTMRIEDHIYYKGY